MQVAHRAETVPREEQMMFFSSRAHACIGLVAVLLFTGCYEHHLCGSPELCNYADDDCDFIVDEAFVDDDGVITGARQRLQAYTATLKYQVSPRNQRLVGAVEVRYDRSTGQEGGFSDGPDDRLVPNQTMFLVSLLWSLDI